MTAFLIIGAAGVALLLFSLVVGDLLDGILEFGGDLFSGAALAGFLGAFGFSGAIAYDASDSTPVAIVVGIVAGLVIGGGVGFLAARLKQGGDESNVRTSELTGHRGTVISAIPADGLGEVSVVVAGHITKLNARSAAAIAPGTPVVVTAVLSATAVMVEPA